jgi:predicted GIY-YIG superfamily endonuclease
MGNIGMTKFYYVYLLVDVATESHRYTGVTEDLTARLAKHNAGEVPHTSKFKPWKIETAIAFSSKEKAHAFEAYLKTHSGTLPEAIRYQNKEMIHIHAPQSSEVHRFKGVCYDRAHEADVKVTGTEQIAQMYIHKQGIFTERRVYPYVQKEDLRLDLQPKIRNLAASRNPEHPCFQCRMMTYYAVLN